VIGLDTNVVIRYLAQDEPDQAAAATGVIERLTEDDPGFLSVVTVVEVHRVLRRAYRLARPDVAS
jgi:predicted nucleic-acid-binding protein